MTKELVIKILSGDTLGTTEQTYEAAEMAIKALNNLPSAEKIGKWKNIDVIHDSADAKIPDWQQAQCSVCGLWNTTPYQYYYWHYKFCPNCGALMVKDNE